MTQRSVRASLPWVRQVTRAVMLGAVVQARVWERELELVAQVVTRPFRCVLEVQSVEWHGEERVCAQREAQDQPVHACPPFGRIPSH